jgi:hypothetical protein
VAPYLLDLTALREVNDAFWFPVATPAPNGMCLRVDGVSEESSMEDEFEM